jgi:hypothetical protein
MAEQLICNQQVVGSSPIASSRKKFLILKMERCLLNSGGQAIRAF